MPQQPLIVGRPALLVIDIQKSAFLPEVDKGIPIMPGYREAMARAGGVPVIFIQEVHRPDMVDFGRELDGTEGVHCVEGRPGTFLAAEEMGMRADDYHVPKRRYSAFFATDLEILLKGLKVETLLMVGGMTDVCVHYSFVDGHQHDYHCRVAREAVGGTSVEAHEAALRAMEYLQTGAVRPASEMEAALAAQATAAA